MRSLDEFSNCFHVSHWYAQLKHVLCTSHSDDIGTMLLPRNARNAPWRLVDAGESDASSLPCPASNAIQSLRYSGGGAVDVDEVGSSDDEEG